MNILEAKRLVDLVVDRNFTKRKADISDLVRGLTVEQQQAMHQLNESVNSYRNTSRRWVFKELTLHEVQYSDILHRSRIKIGFAYTALGMGVLYILTRDIYLSVFAGLALGFLVSSIEKETKLFASFLDGYPKPTHIKGSWYHVQKQKISALTSLLFH